MSPDLIRKGYHTTAYFTIIPRAFFTFNKMFKGLRCLFKLGAWRLFVTSNDQPESRKYGITGAVDTCYFLLFFRRTVLMIRNGVFI